MLRHRRIVFLMTFLLLVITVIMWSWIPVELAPQTDADEIDVELEMAQGTNIAVVNIGDDTLSVSLPAVAKVNAGENIGLTIDSRQVHLFQDTKALGVETH